MSIPWTGLVGECVTVCRSGAAVRNMKTLKLWRWFPSRPPACIRMSIPWAVPSRAASGGRAPPRGTRRPPGSGAFAW
eukprot:12130807-Alexandrium_andersonii.AAC.1